MKQFVILCLLLLATPAFGADNFIGELLTGKPKLACETILCLSSPHRPAECNPALSYFYSIKFTKHGRLNVGKTIRERMNFLNMCPTADSYVVNLSGAIANTLNQCDAASLNKRKLIYVRHYNVVKGIFAGWQMLGKRNDDFGTNNKFKLDRVKYPICTQRQLSYAENVRNGSERAPYYVRGGHEEPGYWVYPAGQECYEVKEVVDPNPPADCNNLYKTAEGYEGLKYENGQWKYNQ